MQARTAKNPLRLSPSKPAQSTPLRLSLSKPGHR